MSFNENDPERSVRNHKPAIIAIVVAILVALAAFFIFMPGNPEEGGDGVATTAPADAPLTEAEGTTGGATENVAPESAAPVEGATEGSDAAPTTGN